VSGEAELHLGGLEALGELRGLEPRLRRAARLALDREGAPAGELCLTFLEPAAMRALNRRWLGRDALTDVIAFDLGAEGPDGPGPGGEAARAGAGRRLCGDVYVCPAAAREASRRDGGPPLEEELVRLVVHGVLHVLGHDHPEEGDRWGSPMYRLQESLVERAMAPAAGGSVDRGARER